MYKTVREAANINYLRCPSVVYVNCLLIVLSISCPSVNYVNNPSYSFKCKCPSVVFVNSPFHSFIHKVSISSLC
jgi:hypothetical protein